MTQSPDERVAQSITAALRDKQLVAESRLGDLGKKLVTGAITAADWRNIVEVTLDEEQKATDADTS